MPIIEPFRGLRYDKKKVRSLRNVVTPPYDVISPQGQIQYYKKHPLNFVRVVFGKELSSDNLKKNRYTRARETLEEWIASGILRFDQEPSLYPYLQEYALGKRLFRRFGIIALVRLDSPRILPHEGTREGPMKDRLRLLQTVEASLSPIFGLIPDLHRRYENLIAQICRKKRPVASVKVDGARHLLWQIEEPGQIRKVRNFLRSKELVIADGHHRYEASVAYRNLRRQHDPNGSASCAYNFAMFYLASAGKEEPGLLPTHRLIHRFPHKKLKEFLASMKAQEKAQPVAGVQNLVARLARLRQYRRIGVGLYTGNGTNFLLTAKLNASDDLDVEWLHREIVPEWLGKEVEFSYTQDLDEGIQQVRQDKAQLLFILPPPSLASVMFRARNASRMPGKTTFFYPKPLAGLVEYKF